MKSPMQRATEQIRRLILTVLEEAQGAVRAKLVHEIMLIPTTWEDFLAQVEYLAAAELIRIFPARTDAELSPVAQAQYLEMCRRARYDSDHCNKIMVRIRLKGRDFLEGNATDIRGVAAS